jgi:hypothetical protein
MSLNFNDLPNDIKNIIFKMNPVLDTPEYHEFSCTPLECELRGVDPYEEEIWEDLRDWEIMNSCGYCNTMSDNLEDCTCENHRDWREYYA